jgi:hypothetical protein
MKEKDASFSTLEKEDHFNYLKKYLKSVGKFSQGLDTGHPWLMFWTLNGMHMLEEK